MATVVMMQHPETGIIKKVFGVLVGQRFSLVDFQLFVEVKYLLVLFLLYYIVLHFVFLE